MIRLTLVAPLLLLLAACSVGIGYRIPGTPVSIGTSVPLSRGSAADKARYLDLRIESIPDGAEILVNGQLVGSTPSVIAIPFEKRWFGRAKGSAQVLLRRPGYLPEGVRVFAVGKGISRSEGGPPIDTLNLTLRPA